MEEGRYLNGLKQQEVPVFEEGTCYVRDFTEGGELLVEM
jgi:hypothetical protein